MSVTPTIDSRDPNPPEPSGHEVHPLIALSVAVSLAVPVGLLAGWPAAVTVLLAILGLFVRSRNGSE